MRENADLNNSEYGYFLRSALYCQLSEIFITKPFVFLSSNQILLESSLIFFRSAGELSKIFLTFQNCDVAWNSQLQEFAKNSLYQEISYNLNKHLYIEVVIKKWRDLKIFQKKWWCIRFSSAKKALSWVDLCEFFFVVLFSNLPEVCDFLFNVSQRYPSLRKGLNQCMLFQKIRWSKVTLTD